MSTENDLGRDCGLNRRRMSSYHIIEKRCSRTLFLADPEIDARPGIDMGIDTAPDVLGL